jgi:hypothetical protein
VRVRLPELRGTFAHVCRQKHFAHCWGPHALLDQRQGSLVRHGERTHLFDRVTPVLHAQRMLLSGRKDVKDAATHGHLATTLDEVCAFVPQFHQTGDRSLDRSLISGAKHHGLLVRESGHDGLKQGAHRCHHHIDRLTSVGAGVREATHHRDATSDSVRRR